MQSRHLIGVFLAVVVMCGVFFTLGYVMGRTEQGGRLGVASAASKGAPRPAETAKAEKPATPTGSTPPEWDFYSSSARGKGEDRLTSPTPAPAGKATAASPPASSVPAWASSTARPAPSKLVRFKPPLIPRGAIVLQVAALTKDGDALALADALQQKHYPAFVLAPTSDNLYRVQVGPYADSRSAEIAKRSLEREGFKTIVKR